MSSTPSAILADIKVIDFTHIFSGPQTTQILGDLGADIIKVERRHGGDPARSYGQAPGEGDLGGSFIALNRNKRSIAIDLGTDEGVSIAQRLAEGADVLVQNFKVGQMAKWGLDYASLSKRNPRLIYASISGFGAKGPLAERAANDLVIQAYSGLMSFTGEPGGGPVRAGTAVADLSAGTNAALGIMAALFHRERTGEGQEVSTSMLEGMVSLMNYFFVDYWAAGIVPEPLGTANRLGIPNQAFPTKDGWVVISNANEAMWSRCCQALGIPEAALDPRFSSLAQRYQHTGELVDVVSAATARMTTAEALEALGAANISCGPINDIPGVARAPQLEALNIFFSVPIGEQGESARVVATPLTFSETPLGVWRGVPSTGQHTEEILIECGYSADDIRDLQRSQVI